MDGFMKQKLKAETRGGGDDAECERKGGFCKPKATLWYFRAALVGDFRILRYFHRARRNTLPHFNFTPLSFVSVAVSARARTDPIILPDDKNGCR